MSDDQLKTPLLPPNQSFEMNQFPITVELSNVLGKQYHEENYSNNYMRLDQILMARNRWKNLIKEQFHPRVPREKEKSQYFQIEIKRLQQLFDIGFIKEQTWINEKQKRTKEVNTDAEKRILYNQLDKYLKTQLDMLFQLGGVYGISNFLRSNIKNGLNTEDKTDLQERKKYFGPNDKPPLATKGILLVIIWLLKYDRLVQVQFVSLILFTSLNLIRLQDLDDCFAIFVGLIFMVIFKSLMRQIYNRHVIIHQTEMKHRNCSQSQKLKVWRNGDIEMIDNKDILVGDILFFQQGDYLLCDGILIQQNSLQILVTQPTQDLIEQYCEKNVEDTKVSEQETESFKVYDPFLFSGSHIIEGAGQLLVCSIGQMASDYIAFQQNFAEDSSQKKYLRQNPMYNPFSLKLESVMSRQTILSAFLMIILIFQMLFQYAVWDPEQILGLILYVSLMIPLIVPLNLVQFLNLYMIDIIQTLRMKEIYLKDYLALFWLGQVNEVILDQLNQSVLALKNSNINLRWFSTDFQDICRQLAIYHQLIEESDPIEVMFVDSIQIQQMFNEKNKFTFTSRRFASPTVDYVKIDKITSGRTLDQIESRGSTFAFQGVVDAESLYEHIKFVSVVSRCSHKDKELLISFLKLFDRIILLSGDDSDRLAMEIAHISIGKMDTQAAIRLGNNNLVDSVYNSLGCGRCVYFVIHQISKAYCSSAVLILVTNIVWQYACELFLFQFLNMLILNVAIYIISLYFTYNQKYRLIHHLMQRNPYQRIMRITDGFLKLFFFKSLLIMCQLILISYFGRLEELQLIIDGLILNDHIGTLTRPIMNLSIIVKSATFGLILILLENYLSTGTQYIYESMLYRDYLIGLLIIHINQSLCKLQ